MAENVPTSYKEATTCEDADAWKAAMVEEMTALTTNDTWSLVDLRPEIMK